MAYLYAHAAAAFLKKHWEKLGGDRARVLLHLFLLKPTAPPEVKKSGYSFMLSPLKLQLKFTCIHNLMFSSIDLFPLHDLYSDGSCKEPAIPP